MRSRTANSTAAARRRDMDYGKEIAAGPGRGAAAAGEDGNCTAYLADRATLDGKLLPPLKAVRQSPSAADEATLAEQIRAEHDAGERSLKDAVRRFRKCS